MSAIGDAPKTWPDGSEYVERLLPDPVKPRKPRRRKAPRWVL